MQKEIMNFKDKLEDCIAEYSDESASPHTVEIMTAMIDCWNKLNCTIEYLASVDNTAVISSESQNNTLSDTRDISMWTSTMINSDSSTSPHWNVSETTPYANNLGIKFSNTLSANDWNIAMNLMYSDYCETAKTFGVDVPTFYANLAEDFLYDCDTINEHTKLVNYYTYIVE